MDHGNSPALRRINTAGTALFHAKCIFFPKMDLGNIVAASVPASAIAPASDQMVHSFGWAARPIAKAIRRDRRNSVLARRTTGFQFCRNFVHGRRTTGNRARYRRSGKIGNFLGNVRNGPRDRALSACSVESVRKDHVGLHSFLSMHLIDARRRNARPRRLRFSQSLARRLHRPSHANVRSTTHRLGKTMKPFA